MTEIYEVLNNEPDFDEKFSLMLDKTLNELGSYKEPKKLPREIINCKVKWSESGHIYYWINFKEWLLGPMKNTFGSFVHSEEFLNTILIPYLKNHYEINQDKEIKLKSVDFRKEYIDDSKKKCIVIEKAEGGDRSWITSENLIGTLKKFLKYYFECRNSSCRNYDSNKVTVIGNDMVKLECNCCSSSINIKIYK